MSNRKSAISALTVALILASAHFAAAQPRYSAKQTGDIVQLRDTKTDTTVSVMTSVSNAYEMVVKGQDLIRMTFATVDDFRARPGLNGIPLLAPFANRLDEPAFYANGKKYNFDMELGNVRGPIPIHGYLSGAKDWKMVEAKADGNAAWVTNQLDFYRNPQWMQQFPFAHTLTMTYRLQDGTLEVHTRIDSLSGEPMPVAIGFHPYFQLTDSPREEWRIAINAKTHWKLEPSKLPTGETEPITQFLPDPKHVVVKNVMLDDIFTDLERDERGQATLSLIGKAQQVDVLIGPKFRAALVYTPPNDPNRGGGPGPNPAAAVPMRGSVAFEPMAAITNALNLTQKGLYKELQSIEPGGSWEESFWIRPHGF